MNRGDSGVLHSIRKWNTVLVTRRTVSHETAITSWIVSDQCVPSLEAGLLTELLKNRAENKRAQRQLQSDQQQLQAQREQQRAKTQADAARKEIDLPNHLKLGEIARLQGSIIAVDHLMDWLEVAKTANRKDESQARIVLERTDGTWLDSSMHLLLVDYNTTVLATITDRALERVGSVGRAIAQMKIELDEMGLEPENCLLIQVRVMDGLLKGMTGWVQASLLTPE